MLMATIASLEARDGTRFASTSSRLSRRRWLAASLGAGFAALGSRVGVARQATPLPSPVISSRDWKTERWVGAWAAAPHRPTAGLGDQFPSQILELADQTVRQIVRASIGGEQVRVRLANTFGTKPLVIGAAHIGLRDADERIDPPSDQALTFSGKPSVTIPPGVLVLSDPVDLAIPPLAELAVSLYFPQATTTDTVHGFALQTNYVSRKGDFTAATALPVDSMMQSWVFLTGVDVAVTAPTGAIVALGDSITDGTGSTPDTNHRWPDLLAERLVAGAHVPLAVLNKGIGGNRLLHDPPPGFEFAGPSALARFDRDVLAQAGVTHLIVFEGINDIGMPALADVPAEVVSADDLIVALSQLAERAHERGIVALGATITPFKGAAYYSAKGEATRQSVNDWIRTGGVFDGAIDFDAVVRDPAGLTRLLAAYDSGDQLHINDAGYQAMADSIDLSLFEIAGRD
jgi:lysophospholipase L1-like esterase